MKEVNYLWHIGRFYRAHMGQSIHWIVIGRIISLDMLVHKYKTSVQLVPVLCISWTSGKCCCYYYHYYCCCVLLPSTVLLFIVQVKECFLGKNEMIPSDMSRNWLCHEVEFLKKDTAFYDFVKTIFLMVFNFRFVDKRWVQML